MSPDQWYRRREHQLFRALRKFGRNLYSAFRGGFSRWGSEGRQSYTVMIVPHSEEKIVNFKVTVLALHVIVGVSLAVIAVLVFYFSHLPHLEDQAARTGSQVEMAQINLDLVREEVAQLRLVARDFEAQMARTLGTAGMLLPSHAPAGQPNSYGHLHEVAELRTLEGLLQSAMSPIDQLGGALASQKTLLVEIPTLWPLKDVRGWVTNPFGPSIHPFTGQWYLHKGIDIAQRLGTPIVATANGVVTRVDYEALGYGHYLDIKHNYGFLTKYGHLTRAYVKRGQEVVRGQVIGGLGTSGLSTGPHLHYEVRIGNQVVDPSKYLSFSASLLTD